MSGTIRKQFADRLNKVARGELPKTSMGVDKADLRSLRIYFNNRQHNPRAERDETMAKLAANGPFKLYMQTEADYFFLLQKQCYLDPLVRSKAWRNTDFTRRFGVKERNIMDDAANLYLVGFRDEQDERSLTFEQRRWPGCEGMKVVPVYEMRDRKGNSFQFIIRPWQQGGDPITILN